MSTSALVIRLTSLLQLGNGSRKTAPTKKANRMPQTGTLVVAVVFANTLGT